MKTLETRIEIDAAPQTVWSIMDDLARYPEWNALVPDLAGRTTVGEIVTGTLVQPETPNIPLSPTLTRIVGARELRWLTVVPGDEGFTAEHYFILRPTGSGGTELIHNENFDGPAVPFLWDGVDTNGRQAYNQMNVDLKHRAEAMKAAAVSLHLAVDAPTPEDNRLRTSRLTCRCAEEPVEVTLSEEMAHNHLCGCSKCWKPSGALFAQTAVVARDALHVTANEEKLAIVDDTQAIQRYACIKCGTHMYGRVEDRDHHFYGIDFVHPELGDTPSPFPEFAGFVSSIIEGGTSPSLMEAVRSSLSAKGIPSYDAFSPEIMDLIAWHKIKMANASTAPHTSP